MNRRRKILIAAMFVAPLLVVGAACTFPDVSFRDGTDAATQQPGNETGPGTDSPVDTPDSPNNTTDAPTTDDQTAPPQDGGLGDADARTRPDGSVVIEGGAGCDARCDCDLDGYLKFGCDAAAPGDTHVILGVDDDCDDFDDQVHPGQIAYFEDKPVPPNTGDWDCNKTIQKGTAETVCPSISVGGCDFDTFNQTVGCGEQAILYRCKTSGVGSCAATALHPTKPDTQSCR